MIDRSEVNRALAKAIAYKNCGKDQLSEAWTAELVRLLGAASIIDPSYLDFAYNRALGIAPITAWGRENETPRRRDGSKWQQ